MTYFNKNFTIEDSLFPVLRLLFPKLDKTRKNYGLKEKNLARYYSEILSLPEKETLMLKNWKKPEYLPKGVAVNIIF